MKMKHKSVVSQIWGQVFGQVEGQIKNQVSVHVRDQVHGQVYSLILVPFHIAVWYQLIEDTKNET